MKLLAILITITLFGGVVPYFFREKKKTKPYPDPERDIPPLRIHSTIVPQSFVEESNGWDSHLYKNQTLLLGQ